MRRKLRCAVAVTAVAKQLDWRILDADVCEPQQAAVPPLRPLPLCAGRGAAHGAARRGPGGWSHPASRRRKEASGGGRRRSGGGSQINQRRYAADRGPPHKLLWYMQCAIDIPVSPNRLPNWLHFGSLLRPSSKRSTRPLCSMSPSCIASNPCKASFDCQEPRSPTHPLQEAVARAASRLA